MSVTALANSPRPIQWGENSGALLLVDGIDDLMVEHPDQPDSDHGDLGAVFPHEPAVEDVAGAVIKKAENRPLRRCP